MIKKKHYSREIAPAFSVGVGTSISLLMGLSGGTLLTYFVHSGNLQLQSATWFVVIMHFVGAVAGGITAWLLSGRKHLVIPLISVVGYVLVLLCGHFLLIDEKITLSGPVIMSLFLSLIVIAVACYLGGEKKRYKFKKR